MPMKRRPSRLATEPVVPTPKNGSRITSPGLEGGKDHPMQQGLGLLGRVRLGAGRVLHPLFAGGQRQGPVGAHLQIVVGQLHGVVVEGVAPRAARLGGPDQGLVRVGEAGALEIRHRVGLAPDHVVQDPEAQVLERRADAEDVVVAADHPERAVILQHPAGGGQPFASETVVGRERGELVPVVIDRVDLGIVRAAAGRRRAADCRADRRTPGRPTSRAASPSRRCTRPE